MTSVMLTRDTTVEAAAAQSAAYKRMGPSGRFSLALEMSDMVRECAKAGIRARHPEYTEAEVTRQLLRCLYGALPDRP